VDVPKKGGGSGIDDCRNVLVDVSGKGGGGGKTFGCLV
jgi:hypothetical protein